MRYVVCIRENEIKMKCHEDLFAELANCSETTPKPDPWDRLIGA